MSTKLKMSLIGAAISLALIGQANAAIEAPRSDNDNNGSAELVLTVFDAANGITYTKDLGITMGAFDSLGSYNFDVAADMTSSFGNINADGLVWTVNAADSVYGTSAGGSNPDPAAWGTRILSTSTTATPGVMTNGLVNQSALTFGQYLDGANLQAGHNDGNVANNGSSTYVGAGSASYQLMNAGGGQWNSNSSFTATGNVGDTLSFLMMAEDVTLNVTDLGFMTIIDDSATLATDPAILSLMDGTWTLDTAGTLNYSAVPIPPAIWLLGSALVGLTGVARRRRESEAETLEA